MRFGRKKCILFFEHWTDTNKNMSFELWTELFLRVLWCNVMSYKSDMNSISIGKTYTDPPLPYTWFYSSFLDPQFSGSFIHGVAMNTNRE